MQNMLILSPMFLISISFDNNNVEFMKIILHMLR